MNPRTMELARRAAGIVAAVSAVGAAVSGVGVLLDSGNQGRPNQSGSQLEHQGTAGERGQRKADQGQAGPSGVNPGQGQPSTSTRGS